MIGSALVDELKRRGHPVTRLVRANASAGDALWNPSAGMIDAAAIEGAWAVVHLAGEGIAESKWTAEHKRRVLDSRVAGTTLLAKTIAGAGAKPSVFASGSAIGFYGDRGDTVLTEESSVGKGFLADVVAQWEASTAAAEAAGVRTVHLRTGIVLSTRGGALKQQILPFKLGLGGRLGSGKQWLPWISIVDEVNAIIHTLETPGLSGAVNLVGPNPVTNAQFTKALGKALHRPTLLPIPLLPLKVRYSAEMVQEMLLSSARVQPGKLRDSGFSYSQPNLDDALAMLLSEDR